MIIARLAGGLGNQMFQYAFARALAKHHGVPFGLDLSFFRDNPVSSQRFTARVYELGKAFGIEREISREEVEALAVVARRKTPEVPYLLLVEGRTDPDMGLFDLGPNLFLEGYFQSERYFANAAKEVREDFTFAALPPAPVAAIEKRIRETGQPVAVHIRRGDFRNIPDVMPLCSDAYYAEAVRLVRSTIADPYFFVFSATDTQWGEQLFSRLGVSFEVVDDRLEAVPDYESLRLMADCRHHIIANSSFSWWGAWLGRSEDQVVVCPSLWQLHSPRAKQIVPGWNVLDTRSGQPVLP